MQKLPAGEQEAVQALLGLPTQVVQQPQQQEQAAATSASRHRTAHQPGHQRDASAVHVMDVPRLTEPEQARPAAVAVEQQQAEPEHAEAEQAEAEQAQAAIEQAMQVVQGTDSDEHGGFGLQFD